MKRIAIVQLSHEQLLPLLNLPIGTKIDSVVTDSKASDLVNISVTHGHLNEVPDGVAPPIVKPVFVTHSALKEFENWGPQVVLEPPVVVVPKPVSVVKPVPGLAPVAREPFAPHAPFGTPDTRFDPLAPHAPNSFTPPIAPGPGPDMVVEGDPTTAHSPIVSPSNPGVIPIEGKPVTG